MHGLHAKNYIIELDALESLQEPPIFDGKKPWFPPGFLLNQSFEEHFKPT